MHHHFPQDTLYKYTCTNTLDKYRWGLQRIHVSSNLINSVLFHIHVNMVWSHIEGRVSVTPGTAKSSFSNPKDSQGWQFWLELWIFRHQAGSIQLSMATGKQKLKRISVGARMCIPWLSWLVNLSLTPYCILGLPAEHWNNSMWCHNATFRSRSDSMMPYESIHLYGFLTIEMCKFLQYYDIISR